MLAHVVQHVPEHDAKLAWNPWRTQHQAAAYRQLEAHGAAHRVRQDPATLGQHRLLEIGAVGGDAAASTPGFDVSAGLGIFDQRDAGYRGQDFRCQVVDGRPEAAVDDHDIGVQSQVLQLSLQRPGLISQCDLAAHRQPVLPQDLGDHGRVRVYGIAAHDLVAGQKQLDDWVVPRHGVPR